MKPTTINVQITRNPKQYEAVRLGLEATLDPGDTVEKAIKAATAQLNGIYEEMYGNGQKAQQTPQKAPENETQAQVEQEQTREPLKFGDPRLQQIVVRIEKAAGDTEKLKQVLNNVNKYFKPDSEAQKVIDLAVKLNK
jgi:hypothetical protein